GSHVRGRVHYEKPQSTFPLGTRRTPRVIIGPGAVVDGPLVFEHEVELFVHDTARTGTVTGATAQAHSGEGAPARDRREGLLPSGDRSPGRQHPRSPIPRPSAT